MKLRNNRDPKDIRCHWVLCRDEYAVTYRAGATSMNKDDDLKLCEFHDKRFITELDEHDAKRKDDAA